MTGACMPGRPGHLDEGEVAVKLVREEPLAQRERGCLEPPAARVVLHGWHTTYIRTRIWVKYCRFGFKTTPCANAAGTHPLSADVKGFLGWIMSAVLPASSGRFILR